MFAPSKYDAGWRSQQHHHNQQGRQPMAYAAQYRRQLLDEPLEVGISSDDGGDDSAWEYGLCTSGTPAPSQQSPKGIHIPRLNSLQKPAPRQSRGFAGGNQVPVGSNGFAKNRTASNANDQAGIWGWLCAAETGPDPLDRHYEMYMGHGGVPDERDGGFGYYLGGSWGSEPPPPSPQEMGYNPRNFRRCERICDDDDT